MDFAVLAFWIGAVVLRFLIVYAIEHTISIKQQTGIAVVSGVLGFVAAYLFKRIGAHGAFANVASAAVGFFVHFGIQRLYKLQKN